MESEKLCIHGPSIYTYDIFPSYKSLHSTAMKATSSTAAPVIALVVAVLATRWWILNQPGPDYPTAANTVFIKHPSEIESLPIDGAFGGESIAFDPNGGGPYVGVSDGRILKWNRQHRRWDDFAVTSPNREECERSRDHELTEHTCGRPLGLRFHVGSGDLYIADAHMGLLIVGPNGGLATKVWTHVDGLSPFGLTNGLDIDQSRVIYFTDSSTRYKRRDYLAAFLTGDSTGRLMKYDPETKQVSVLVENLKFPNGVSLSKDGKSVLLIESISCKVLRYWLEGASKAGTLETVVELPGFPDNIKRNEKGKYWVGVYSKKTMLSEFVLSRPWVGNAFASCPIMMRAARALARMKATGMGFKLSEEGDIVEVLEDQSGSLKFVSEVEEKEGDLYFGSVIMPFVGVLKKKTKVQ